MAITSQFDLEKGLRIVDEAQLPSSAGRVSDRGMHIPDVGIIDGKNILPTQSGYTSFFGKDRNIDDTVLASLKVQEILTYRTKHGDVVQLAFTSAGLYLSSTGGSATATRTYTAAAGDTPAFIAIDLPAGQGDWIWVLGATLGHASPWELWTYVLLENNFYLYHKGLKHIYKMYSVEPEQVLFDELDPTYIISNDKVWQFTINAEDDSDGDDTYKAVEFNTDSSIFLGKYSHPVDKAHQVWNAEKLVLSPFHIGLPARIENLSRAKVDVNATIDMAAGYDEDTVLITADGEAEEMIISWEEFSNSISFLGRNPGTEIELLNVTSSGTLTLEIGSGPAIASVNTYIDITDSKAVITKQIIDLVAELGTDADILSWELTVTHYKDLATNKDEISLFFLASINASSPSASIDMFGSFTGTGTLNVTNKDGYWSSHVYEELIKPLYRIDELSGYATYTEGEVVTVTVDDIDYSVTATAAESSSSVLARLKAVILANADFEEVVLATPDGSFSWTKVSGVPWDLGASRETPITVSNNIQLVGNAWESTDTAGLYTPEWAPTAFAETFPRLRIEGFKQFGLTVVNIVIDGTPYSLPMSSIYDSNDLVDVIYTLLSGLSIGSNKTIDTPASATADYDLVVNVPIFDGSTPSPTLTQDGTTLWAVDGGATTSETVELLQVDGIFQARGRIGYWTRDNLEGWSASNDPMDFVPSTVTRANQISIKAVKGDIVKVIGYEDGFITYATGNVIHARYIKDSVNVFTFDPIDEAPGIIDPRHVTNTRDTHFYWHTTGLYVLDPLQGAVKEQLGEISDYINTYSHPITIQSIAGRFLVVNLLENYPQFSNRSVREGNSTIAEYVAQNTGSPVEITSPEWGDNLYPTYKRAFIYDTKLQRWGSCDQEYLVLASLTPWNQSGYQADKDYSNLSRFLDNHQRGILVLGTDGKLWIANDNPTDGYLVVGHYAAHRTRRTKVVETYLEFAVTPEATMDFEPSLDWKTVEWQYKSSKDIEDLRVRVSPNMSAYWFNFVLRGRFHLTRGMVKGYSHGR